MIPFNTSRSNSIIILGYLYKNHGLSKTKDEIKSHTKTKYFDEYDSVGIRLREQEASGNITQKNGEYIITKRGIFIIELFMNITDLYNIQNNYGNEAPSINSVVPPINSLPRVTYN